MQLSPNRVHEDFDYNMLDVFPVFTVCPRTDGYLPCVSLVSSPSSPVSLAAPAAPTVGSLLDEATGSFDDNIGSPATLTSLSITDHAANLHLLSEPLIPLPDAILLDTDPARLPDLTHQDFVPPQGPVSSVAPPPAVLAWEGPFHASIEPTATGNHPLISTGLTGCPYRMTTYRGNDIANVDTSFGVQIHHPQFLECVGAPETAQLLGRPPAEWLQIINRRDALIAAVQLQFDGRIDGIKPGSAQPVCGRIASHVHGGNAVCVRPGVLSDASSRRRCAGAPSTSGINSDGGHGPLTSLGYSAPGRGLPGLSQMSSAAVQLCSCPVW